MSDDWEKSILAWREKFERARRNPYGWLSLVGLDFLEPGDNIVGSSKSSRVRLPNHCLPEVGVISITDEALFFTAAPAANVRFKNEPVLDSVGLTPDDEDAFLEADQVRFHVMRRGDKYCVRIKDPAAESRRTFKGTEWFDPDQKWNLEGRFVPAEAPRSIEIPNALGGIDRVMIPGVVAFSVEGKTHSLAVQGTEDNGFFIVFGDDTNGEETYPPGRFITTPPPKQRRVLLDFNRAHNPPCALTPFATCPYPPIENRLGFAIPAGERFSRD